MKTYTTKNVTYELYEEPARNGFYYGKYQNVRFPAWKVEGKEDPNKEHERSMKKMMDEAEELDFQNKQEKPFVINERRPRIRKIFNNGLTQREFMVEEYAITESTQNYLAKEIFTLVRNERFKAMQKEKARGGINIYVMLRTCDAEKKKWFPFVMNGANIKENDIKAKLGEIMARNYDTANYILYINSVVIMISHLGVDGGCSARHKKTKEKMDKDTTIHIQSYESRNENCLIQCFNHHYELKIKPDTVRKDLKIPKGKIDISFIPKLSQYYNEVTGSKYGYNVINQNYDFLLATEPKETDIKIILQFDHYSCYSLVNYKKCDECGKRLREDNVDHVCNFQVGNFYRVNKKKDKTFINSFKKYKEDKIDYNNIIHWDLETFKENINGVHVPYASAWNVNGITKMIYGKEIMKKTVDDFITFDKKIISAYNGSGFDFYFLIEELSKRGIKITDMIKTNGRLMSFKFGTNKVFDLCLYLSCSLDKACKDYKIVNKKSSFDHDKMKTWDDVEKYRSEVEPYLEKDVLALKEVSELFNDMIHEKFKLNIYGCMSAGQLGYNIWLSTVETKIEVPTLEKYEFIKLGTYGARCYPQKKRFESKTYNSLKTQYQGKELYDKLKQSGDYIFNADATSLYPASMAGFDLVKVAYPLGKSRWSEQPKTEYNKNKMGIYEVEFIAPKKLRVPILPTRRMMGNRNVGINWSLENGKGIYCNIDIKNAIECGYTVNFINKCLVWDETGDVFSKYISMFYEMKEEAERNKNNVARSVAKLFLNSLYGKTLQKANVSNSTMVNNLIEFNKFIKDYDLTDFNLYENKILVSGIAKNKEKKITKPSQLGCFVTAYSRKIMLTYMKEIDPTLTTCVFTYTDTDSLHMTGEAYCKLKEKGFIKNKKDSKLGYLCSDIDDEGIIFNEINLSPKCYLYEYITEKGEVKEEDMATMKCKGIVKKKLKANLYKEEKKEELEFTSLRKKHNKLTSGDRDNGINHFNIVQTIQKRTFNSTEWKGMLLKDNEFFPIGYEF